MRIRVVGGGIVGLACALRCVEAGHAVDVVAAEFGDATTSSIAAALWYPYRALPQEAVTRWAAIGFAVLAELARHPETGVDLRTGQQLFRVATPDPWWISAVPQLDRIAQDDLPPGYTDGFELAVPVVDMPIHLRWLEGRLRDAGVSIVRDELGSLDQARSGVDVVVNCSGLGARRLASDDELYSVRGQVVLLANPGLERWVLDESEPAQLTYVVPRRDSVVVGGTALEHDEDIEVRPATAQAILHRATALVSELAGTAVLAHRVGLRPARPAVRLERIDDVVHCYGHGGAGVTLAYGCAQDVVTLIG